MSEFIAYAAVLGVAVIFTVLSIVRQSKLSVVWGFLSFIFWSVAAGVHMVVYYDTPSLLILSYAWLTIGIVILVISLAISISLTNVERQKQEFEV